MLFEKVVEKTLDGAASYPALSSQQQGGGRGCPISVVTFTRLLPLCSNYVLENGIILIKRLTADQKRIGVELQRLLLRTLNIDFIPVWCSLTPPVCYDDVVET